MSKHVSKYELKKNRRRRGGMINFSTQHPFTNPVWRSKFNVTYGDGGRPQPAPMLRLRRFDELSA